MKVRVMMVLLYSCMALFTHDFHPHRLKYKLYGHSSSYSLTCVSFFNLLSFWTANVLVSTVAVYLKQCCTAWMSSSVNLNKNQYSF